MSPGAAPTLAPNGTSGTPAITLTNGTLFTVSGSSTLYLTGWSGGNAVFFAGDGTAGEYISNGGTVTYTGVSGTDYIKVPVLNGNSWAGIFNVNGGTNLATLQVSGTDSNTNNVSFYQNSSSSQTNIYGGGTLWCANNFTMTGGQLQTTDGKTDTLQVGTSGSNPVDGTVNLLGGRVNINPGTNVYGTLQIVGTTMANVPIVNVGGVTLNFKVNMAVGSSQCDKLIVGSGSGSGKVNFGYNGTNAEVAISAQGNVTTGHQWQVILFGSVTNTSNVVIFPATGYTPKWNSNNLEIDN